jgi:hypothetical protein
MPAAQSIGRSNVIPAKERVKQLNPEPLQNARPSFPRRRESISGVGTSAYMGTRLRGYDAAARNSGPFAMFGDFSTRSKAGIHV